MPNVNSTPGGASFGAIYVAETPPAPGTQQVTNAKIANNLVTPAINATVPTTPVNFILGTTGGADDPFVIPDGTAAIYPVDNGNPEYSLTYDQLLGSANAFAPEVLDPATFAAWTMQQQAAYMALWGVTSALIGTSGTNVGNGSSALVATTTSTGAISTQSVLSYVTSTLNSVAAPNPNSANLLTPLGLEAYANVAPADLDPSTFNAWTKTQQFDYLDAVAMDASNPNQSMPVVIGADVDPSDAFVAQGAVSSASGTTITITSLADWANKNIPVAIPLRNKTLADAPFDLGVYGGTPPSSLDPDIFNQWTSEQQAEYLNFWLTNGPDSLESHYGSLAAYNAANGTDLTQWSQAAFIIGSDPATQLTAVLSSTDPNQVYIVNSLQSTDLAGMSALDLTAVSSTAEFQAIAPNLGLGLTSASVAPTQILTDIDSIAGTLPTGFYLVPGSASSDLVASPPITVTSIPPDGASITTNSVGTEYTAISTTNGVTTQSTITVASTPGGTPGVPTSGATATLTVATYSTAADGTISEQTSNQANLVLYTAAPSGLNPNSYQVSFTPAPATTSGTPSTSNTMTISQIGAATLASGTIQNLTMVTLPGSATPIDVAAMPTADRQVFIDELNLLYSQVQSDPVIDDTQVSTEINDIMQRYNTAALYYNAIQSQPTSGPSDDSPLLSGVLSDDGGASFQQAYNSFMQSERAILAAAQNQESLIEPPNINSPALDAPISAELGLTDMMNAQESVVTDDSTELQQLQNFLSELSTMQSLVNYTVQTIGTSTTNQTGFLGASSLSNILTTSSTVTGISSQELSSLISMFDSTLNNGGLSVDPALQLAGITLPGIDFAHGDLDSQGWSSVGSQLSSLATELQSVVSTLSAKSNQDTQLSTNIYTEATSLWSNDSTLVNTIGTDWNS